MMHSIFNDDKFVYVSFIDLFFFNKEKLKI